MYRFYSLFRVIMGCIAVVVLAGCTSEYNLATQQQETLMYGTDKESAIGDSVAQQVEAQFKLLTDVDANERVQRIVKKIADVCDRKDLIFTGRILDDDAVNAVSLPGGYVYIFRGLLDKIKSDDQLAGVIAHEIGHITAKHAIKRLQNSYAYTLLQGAAIASRQRDLAVGVNAIYTSLFFAYSQEDELQSDTLGVKYLKLAGYNPQAMVEVLQILEAEEQKRPGSRFSYFRTHPFIPERIAVVNKEITGALDFKSYLNLTGDKK